MGLIHDADLAIFLNFVIAHDIPQTRTLLSALETYHEDTYQHSLRVGALATKMGYSLGYGASDLVVLATAGVLHDIGKLYIPLTILTKPTVLTSEERKRINAHGAIGYDLLSEQNYPLVRCIVRDYHNSELLCEHPEIAHHAFTKIVATADCVDALAHPRAYKSEVAQAVIADILSKQLPSSYVALAMQFQ